MTQLVQIRVRAPRSVLASGNSGILRVEPLGKLPDSLSIPELKGVHRVRLNDETSEFRLPRGQYLASVRTPAGKSLKEVFTVGDGPVEITIGGRPRTDQAKAGAPSAPLTTRARDALPVASEHVVGYRLAPTPAIVSRSEAVFEPTGYSVVAEGKMLWPTDSHPPVIAQFSARVGEFPPSYTIPDPRPQRQRRGVPRDVIRSLIGYPVSGELPFIRVKTPNTVEAFRTAPDSDEVDLAHYAVLTSGGTSGMYWLARLPGHWREVRTQTKSSVTFQVKRVRSQKYTLSVDVSDPDIQSVHGFMRQGDLEGALTILAECLPLLANKAENPYAAAAAGYVLLHSPPGLLDAPWEDWVGNLGSWFHDLPDGLIQHATLLLQRHDPRLAFRLPNYFPETAAARAVLARALLLKSMARGLPLYRSGLRLLVSNLRILLELNEAPEVRQAYETASWLLMRVSTSEAFTVLDLSDLRMHA